MRRMARQGPQRRQGPTHGESSRRASSPAPVDSCVVKGQRQEGWEHSAQSNMWSAPWHLSQQRVCRPELRPAKSRTTRSPIKNPYSDVTLPCSSSTCIRRSLTYVSGKQVYPIQRWPTEPLFTSTVGRCYRDSVSNQSLFSGLLHT